MYRFSDAQRKQIAKLYNDSLLSDIGIKISGDQILRAHRVLLYISWTYAKDLFSGSGAFIESNSGVIDLSGYDSDLVKICLRSVYEPDAANEKMCDLIKSDVSMFSAALDLVTYLGINRLHIHLEHLGYELFNDIYYDRACMTFIINSLINSPGQRKGEIAKNIIRKLRECYDAVNVNTDDLEHAIEYIDIMQSLDNIQLSCITRLVANATSHLFVGTAFHLWVHWYRVHSEIDQIFAKNTFDEAMSKGVVDMKALSEEVANKDTKIMEDIDCIKNTITYNWIMNQYPAFRKART
jgi:hypothetical protein